MLRRVALFVLHIVPQKLGGAPLASAEIRLWLMFANFHQLHLLYYP
jgi:hypothetical protein